MSSRPGRVRKVSSTQGLSSSTSIRAYRSTFPPCPCRSTVGVYSSTRDRSAVVDGHDDERLDAPLLDQPLRGLVGLPLLPGQEGGGAVEDVLPVVHVQDGEAALGLVLVHRGQVDPDPSLEPEDLGVEIAEPLHRPGQGVDLAETLLLLGLPPAVQAPARVEGRDTGDDDAENEGQALHLGWAGL